MIIRQIEFEIKVCYQYCSPGNSEKIQLQGILKILRIEAEVHIVIMPDIYSSKTEMEKYTNLNTIMREHSTNTVSPGSQVVYVWNWEL